MRTNQEIDDAFWEDHFSAVDQCQNPNRRPFTGIILTPHVEAEHMMSGELFTNSREFNTFPSFNQIVGGPQRGILVADADTAVTNFDLALDTPSCHPQTFHELNINDPMADALDLIPSTPVQYSRQPLDACSFRTSLDELNDLVALEARESQENDDNDAVSYQRCYAEAASSDKDKDDGHAAAITLPSTPTDTTPGLARAGSKKRSYADATSSDDDDDYDDCDDQQERDDGEEEEEASSAYDDEDYKPDDDEDMPRTPARAAAARHSTTHTTPAPAARSQSRPQPRPQTHKTQPVAACAHGVPSVAVETEPKYYEKLDKPIVLKPSGFRLAQKYRVVITSVAGSEKAKKKALALTDIRMPEGQIFQDDEEILLPNLPQGQFSLQVFGHPSNVQLSEPCEFKVLSYRSYQNHRKDTTDPATSDSPLSRLPNVKTQYAEGITTVIRKSKGDTNDHASILELVDFIRNHSDGVSQIQNIRKARGPLNMPRLVETIKTAFRIVDAHNGEQEAVRILSRDPKIAEHLRNGSVAPAAASSRRQTKRPRSD